MHTAGDNYHHLSRMEYLGVRVTVMVSELSVSGSETYLVIAYKVIALFNFFTYSDKSHISFWELICEETK